LIYPPIIGASAHPVWTQIHAAPHRQQECVGRQSKTGRQRQYWTEEREQGSCHAQRRSRSSSRQAAGITGPWVVTRRRLGCYLVWASRAAVVIVLTMRLGPLGQMDASHPEQCADTMPLSVAWTFATAASPTIRLVGTPQPRSPSDPVQSSDGPSLARPTALGSDPLRGFRKAAGS
jgi:hypothetical protein